MDRMRTQQGFTLVELLVVIAVIGIIAGVLLPSLQTGIDEADKVQCSANLRNIHTYAMLYSNRSRSRAFPLATGNPPAAHESLQRLLKNFPDDFQPKIFVCPASDATEAELDENGRFVLGVDSSSYAWVDSRTRNTAKNRTLASDKYTRNAKSSTGETREGHPGGLMVIDTGGSVSFVQIDELNQETMLPKGLVR